MTFPWSPLLLIKKQGGGKPMPFEAEIILKIPLSQNLPEDNLIWIGNKKGVFSVKSAYFIAANLQTDSDVGESSSRNSNAHLWRALWKLKLPAKVKIFSWRACMNGLPVYSKMFKKGIQSSVDCPICGEELESLLHALISCDCALSVWSLWQDYPLRLLLNASDFLDVVHKICSPPYVVHLEYYFAISWSIWHNKNQIAHNDVNLSPLQIWELARNIVESFHEINSELLPAKQPANGGWEIPPLGFCKINVIGATSLDGSGVSAVGVVIRNEGGNLVAALCKALPSYYLAEWTEIFAIEQGILLAQDLAIPNTIFESDASSVIQAITQGLQGDVIGYLIHEIILTKTSFLSCSFRHMKRDYNKATHELAQFAKCNNACHVWKEVFLSFLAHLIQNDRG